MSRHSIAEAGMCLSELIDRALEGEVIVLTREGRPAVELRPVAEEERPLSAADIDWLASHRIERSFCAGEDAGKLLCTMRDEESR
jgi:prevent-host-death family protein